jgi:membrane protease YdiL (CAAX protease family)
MAALLVFPVYLLYQLGLSITSGIRNGADLFTELLLMLRGWHPEALWGLAGAIVVAYGVALWRMKTKKRFSPALFGLVALEGTAHGVVMFLLVNRVMQAIMMGGRGDDYPFHIDVILSLGAGFHEELVFRVLLFGGMIFLGAKIFKAESIWLVIGAALVSSMIFSAIHYVGPLGDPFTVSSFVFRTLAGCYFAAVYRVRGFAVVVYTHAIYDIGIFALT